MRGWPSGSRHRPSGAGTNIGTPWTVLFQLDDKSLAEKAHNEFRITYSIVPGAMAKPERRLDHGAAGRWQQRCGVRRTLGRTAYASGGMHEKGVRSASEAWPQDFYWPLLQFRWRTRG